MNRLAIDINLNKTTFACVHGLPNSENKSTAYDVGRLAAYGMGMFDFRKIVKTKFYEAKILSSGGIVRKATWENTNKLLDLGFCGIKTGFTTPAGACLASCYQNWDDETGTYLNFIFIVLAANQVEDRFIDSQKLLEWAKIRNKVEVGE